MFFFHFWKIIWNSFFFTIETFCILRGAGPLSQRPPVLKHSFTYCLFLTQDQVLHFLKDIFDLDKVRYSSVESLAEDMLHLLHRRSELLLAYLGTDALRPVNSCNPPQVQLVPSALLEARVQWEMRTRPPNRPGVVKHCTHGDLSSYSRMKSDQRKLISR